MKVLLEDNKPKLVIKANEILTEATLYSLFNKTTSETPFLNDRSLGIGRVKQRDGSYAKTELPKLESKYLGISKFGIFNFKTTSQTHQGNAWYQTIEYDTLNTLADIIDDGDHINMRDIQILIKTQDVKLYCDDPSFLYWAMKYMAWQRDYGIEPETRSPEVNNRRLQGALCKHLMNVVRMIQTNQGNVLDQMASDTENWIRYSQGETYKNFHRPALMHQAKIKKDRIDYEKPDSYLNDYFASLAGKNSFLDDKDIKGSLQAEINKINKTEPNMTLDDFIRDEFNEDGVTGLANELKVDKGYIENYFKDLGF